MFAERAGYRAWVREAEKAENERHDTRSRGSFASVVGAFLVGGALVALLGIAGVVVGARAWGRLFDDRAPEARLPLLDERSVVVDSAGNTIGLLYADEDRWTVDLGDVAQSMKDAVVAVEDRRFYQHHGVDWTGIGRAVVANVRSGRVSEGGSTITQQLVKNTFIEAPKRTIRRKIREAYLAQKLEDHATKDEILQRYLNTVYFGNRAYGIWVASARYFDKEPKDLTLPESALLAGLIASPEGDNPITAPRRAEARRTHVLDAMVAMGTITRSQRDEAVRAPLPTSLHKPPRLPFAGYFMEEVKRHLLADERLGATAAQRRRAVFGGGLRITTTFDGRAQLLAEHAVATQLPPDHDPFRAAVVAMDPRTGDVKALVGGAFDRVTGFDLATQGRRQAGSAFKTFTLVAALRDGLPDSYPVDASGPCTFDLGRGSPPWKLDNFEGERAGRVTMRSATEHSYNCAFARLAMKIGAGRIIEVAHRMGIESRLPRVPSITLGTGGVSPLEMAAAYSTLATEGVRVAPRFVTRVETRDGRVLIDDAPERDRVLEPDIAREAVDILTGVVKRGTGRAADIGRPVFGKTGTAQRHRDAWFVGGTPQLVTAVWMGDPDAQTAMDSVGGIRVTGGSYPARIWAAFMREVLRDEPVEGFTPPSVTRAQALAPLARRLAPPRPAPTTLPPETGFPIVDLTATTTPPPTEPPRKQSVPTTQPSPTTVTATTAPPPTTAVQQ
jgi:1A family penicillin-binding protein